MLFYKLSANITWGLLITQFIATNSQASYIPRLVKHIFQNQYSRISVKANEYQLNFYAYCFEDVKLITVEQ